MESLAHNLRLVSWNIRSGGGKRIEGIFGQLLKWQPDIIGLSEFRGTPASQWVAQALHAAGYPHQYSTVNLDKLAVNSLLLASRFPFELVTLPDMPTIKERWLLARINCNPAITIGVMHVPNYTTPKRKYPFLDALLKMTKAWKQGPAILMGDTNCGKRGVDEEKRSPPKFQREHDFIVGIETNGWLDVFRHRHGDRREYTWYSHRNNGFRLDYAFGSPHFHGAIIEVQHKWGISKTEPERREGLSDHAALVIDVDLSKMTG
ncbi:MAG: endonuclease/exonuclease/phosphatase family protein [Chloroflexota bacterium]